MPDISLTRPPDWTALGRTWRTLEARAECSFFQSWSWVGCRAEARFPDPWLLSVTEAGQTLALGLFNRGPRRLGARQLWLNESGSPAMDRIHVEHNGLLLARDAPPGLLVSALSHLVGQGHSLVLDGVDAAHQEAARGTGGLVRQRAHPARSPWIGLAAVRESAGGHLALISANARQQIRRSLRRYASAGPLSIERAGALEEAQAHFAAMRVLHQRTWTQRGQPGAFANPEFVAFHTALLETAWPRGEIDLLRITAGGQAVGFLYNFLWRGQAVNYQSGFDYAGAFSPHHKPGLTCHHLAAEMYAAEGLTAYDLLAGHDRYKTSLATGAQELHWVEVLPPRSLLGLLHRARGAVGRG